MEVTRTRQWEAVGIEHSSREYRLPRLPAIIYNKRGKKKELWSLILDNVSSKRSIIYGSRRNEVELLVWESTILTVSSVVFDVFVPCDHELSCIKFSTCPILREARQGSLVANVINVTISLRPVHARLPYVGRRAIYMNNYASTYRPFLDGFQSVKCAKNLTAFTCLIA